MKLLMFYVHEWWYRTAAKSLEDVPDVRKEESVADAAVIFFHVEAEDEARGEGVLRKFLKNTKWLAGKFGTRTVVLHSFNHLGTSKSSPEFARSLVQQAEERLTGAGYTVVRTPFGYFNEFRMHVAGDSLAKVFKEF
ncbi:MAG: threonyl-tRNA synthetase editing domain-containing protein [Nitrospirota bacterium]